MKKILFNISRALFIITMSAVLVLVLFFQGRYYACKKSFLLPNITIASIVLMVGSLLAVFCCWRYSAAGGRVVRGLPASQSSERKYDRAVLCVTVCLLMAEIYISYNIFFTNAWDPGGIWKTAVARYHSDLGWSLGIAHYFSMYPNNVLLLLLDTFCLKVNGAFGVFQGNYNMMSAIIVDCFAISGACFLVYKILALHVSRKFAFGGFLVAVILCGLSPWMSVCYSDSLGILFPVLTYYLYVKPAKNGRRKSMERALAVIVCCIGYSIKPQCVIILIAIVLVELIRLCDGWDLKQLAKTAALVALACLCLVIHSTMLTKQYESIGVKLDPEKKFGMTHFFMMGLNEKSGGVYSSEDVAYSSSFLTSKQRTEGNIAVSIARLREMGPAGYLRHLSRKLLTTYHDGTFAWGMEGGFYIQVVDDANTRMAPFLKSVYYPDGSRHEWFKIAEQFVWIAVLMFTFAASFCKQTEERGAEMNILTLSIFGLTLFQLLFEVRARYLFLYVPVFCILATLGFENTLSWIQKRLIKKKEG